MPQQPQQPLLELELIVVLFLSELMPEVFSEVEIVERLYYITTESSMSKISTIALG